MTAPPRSPWLWPVLLAIAALGLAVRVAAARGALWLDEAWSAVFAQDVATPAGVFLRIHHDNNHHLNTLWLQLVGMDAPSILQRGLSIATGTAAIVVAGLIVARRGIAASAAAALAFALSPILVTYGSEARGYAPMLLAFLAMVLLLDRWIDRPDRPAPVIGLTILAGVGALAQLTMIFAILALAGWLAITRWREVGPARAARDTITIMGPPALAVAGLVAAILRWLPGDGGFRIGGYQAFSLYDLAVGQSELVAATLGLPIGQSYGAFALIVALAVIAILPATGRRGPLYALAILGIPAGAAVVGLGNAAIARYFLIGAAAMLLLGAEWAGVAFGRSRRRAVAIVALSFVLVGAAWQDVRFLGDRRADPGPAFATMRNLSPAGTTLSLDRPRAAAIVRVATAQSGYPIRLDPCGRFLFVDRDGSEPFPAAPTLCGRRYTAIAGASPTGLSGTHWRLYRRE